MCGWCARQPAESCDSLRWELQQKIEGSSMRFFWVLNTRDGVPRRYSPTCMWMDINISRECIYSVNICRILFQFSPHCQLYFDMEQWKQEAKSAMHEWWRIQSPPSPFPVSYNSIKPVQCLLCVAKGCHVCRRCAIRNPHVIVDVHHETGFSFAPQGIATIYLSFQDWIPYFHICPCSRWNIVRLFCYRTYDGQTLASWSSPPFIFSLYFRHAV